MSLLNLVQIAFILGIITLPISGLYLLFFHKKTLEDYIHEMKVISIIGLIVLGIPFGYRFIQNYSVPTQASPEVTLSNISVTEQQQTAVISFTSSVPVYAQLSIKNVVTGEARSVLPEGAYVKRTDHIFTVSLSSSPENVYISLDGKLSEHPGLPLRIGGTK